MDEREAVLAELQGVRERAAALLRAKLEAVAGQIRDAAARTVGELDVVLPPDLDALFPLGSVGDRLASYMQPVVTTGTLSLEGLRRLDEGRQQSAVLQELLVQLEPWCGPRAIVVFREGQVLGWSGAGFEGGDPSRSWRAAASESVALGKVQEGKTVRLESTTDAVMADWLGPQSRRVLLVPMALRGKVVGSLIAVDGGERFVTETVQLLVFLAGLLMETLNVRGQVPTPSLTEPLAIEPGEAAPFEPEPVLAPPATIPEAAVPAVPAPVPAVGAEVGRVEPEAAAPPHEAPVSAAVPAPEAAPEPEVAPEPQAAPEPQVAPEPEAVARVEAGVTPPVAVTEPAPAAAAPPTAVPVRSPEDERRHEEARRFARLLVSEVRLYNEQAVVEGKASRDIYQRLKEDIDRSREMYEQRIPAEVRAQSNYFFDELVRILADGDPDALGL